MSNVSQEEGSVSLSVSEAGSLKPVSLRCYACQRVSDYNNLNVATSRPPRKEPRIIRVVQQKTRTEVTIPILNGSLITIGEILQHTESQRAGAQPLHKGYSERPVGAVAVTEREGSDYTPNEAEGGIEKREERVGDRP